MTNVRNTTIDLDKRDEGSLDIDSLPSVLPEMVSEENKPKLQEAMEKEQKVLEDKHISRAKYKIEIWLGASRSIWKPTRGAICFWLSGNRIHGGGDEKLYLCPGINRGAHEEDARCEGIITNDMRANIIDLMFDRKADGKAVCPICQRVWDQEELTGELILETTMQHFANLVERYFRWFQCDADIIVKYSPDSIMAQTARTIEKKADNEILDGVRTHRKTFTVVYKRDAILKDTAIGAELNKKILSFLLA